MWPDKKPVNTVLLVRRYKHRKKLFGTTWEISYIITVTEIPARINCLPDLSSCDKCYLGEFCFDEEPNMTVIKLAETAPIKYFYYIISTIE